MRHQFPPPLQLKAMTAAAARGCFLQLQQGTFTGRTVQPFAGVHVCAESLQVSAARRIHTEQHNADPPNSFSTTAIFFPWFSVRMRLISVVLPTAVQLVSGAKLASGSRAQAQGLKGARCTVRSKSLSCKQTIVPDPRKPVITDTGTLLSSMLQGVEQNSEAKW